MKETTQKPEPKQIKEPIKTLKDCSVVELKAMLYDIEQEFEAFKRNSQTKHQAVRKELEIRLKQN